MVKLVDNYNNAFVGVTVSVKISAGTLNGVLTATTNSTGEATFSGLSVATAGSYSLTVSASNLIATSSAFTITAATAAVGRIGFSTQPVSTTASATMSPVVVQLYSSTGAIVDLANVSVTIRLSSGTLTGSLTVMTNSAGQAIFSGLKVAAAGTYELIASATVNGLSLNVTSSAFAI